MQLYNERLELILSRPAAQVEEKAHAFSASAGLPIRRPTGLTQQSLSLERSGRSIENPSSRLIYLSA
ncbi:MAG TPA: hypothetical protein VFN35_15550 [Ktedonobacteraceae bacterium]|nr:hypothetical protein [Ktedonobacteraceae bacterium]